MGRKIRLISTSMCLPLSLLPHCLCEEKPKSHPRHLPKLVNLASFLLSLDPNKDLYLFLKLKVPGMLTPENWPPEGGVLIAPAPADCLSCSGMRFPSSKLGVLLKASV